MAATLTTAEIAAAHHVSLRTAQRWAQQGKIYAVKAGGRWHIHVPAQLDDYKPHQIDKARELIEQGGLVPSTRRPGVWTVVSSDGTTTYLVHSATCSCPAGQRGRACYHRAGVALLEATRRAARPERSRHADQPPARRHPRPRRPHRHRPRQLRLVRHRRPRRAGQHRPANQRRPHEVKERTMSNRTWIVRGGTTGTGPSLFCVYAPDMDTARANAGQTLGTTPYTVHAMRPGDTLPKTLTLAGNPTARTTPAPDYPTLPIPA